MDKGCIDRAPCPVFFLEKAMHLLQDLIDEFLSDHSIIHCDFPEFDTDSKWVHFASAKKAMLRGKTLIPRDAFRKKYR